MSGNARMTNTGVRQKEKGHQQCKSSYSLDTILGDSQASFRHCVYNLFKFQVNLEISNVFFRTSYLFNVLLLQDQLAAIGDRDCVSGSTALGAHRFDLLDYVHALNNRSENHVFAVQPRARHSGDEKLTAVRVWTGVCHAQKA